MSEETKPESELEKFMRKHPPGPFVQSVWVRPEFGIVEIALEDVSYHVEWIKGEGADIGIWRAQDDDRVVGATLPLRNWKRSFGVAIGEADVFVTLNQGKES